MNRYPVWVNVLVLVVLLGTLLGSVLPLVPVSPKFHDQVSIEPADRKRHDLYSVWFTMWNRPPMTPIPPRVGWNRFLRR